MRYSEIVNEIRSNPNIAYYDEQDYSPNHDDYYDDIIFPEYGTRIRDSQGKSHHLRIMFQYEYGALEISFSVDGQYRLTKLDSTAAMRVFSAVQYVVSKHLPELIEKYEFSSVYFAGDDEGGRIKLYDRFIPYVSKILGPHFRFENTRGRDARGKIYRWNKVNTK